jgi:hypothetical protein
MTKDEALDLALEALEKSLPRLAPYGEQDWLDSKAAITAIKQARALDKKAENARELGLDYEPVAQYSDIVSDGGMDPRNKFDTPPASPVQDEHQAFIDSLQKDGEDKMFMQIDHWARQSYKRHKSLICGHMITAADAYESHIIWATLRWAKENTSPNVATPLAAPVQEPVAWMCKRDDGHFDVLTDSTCKQCFPVYTTPPAAQRQWVGTVDCIGLALDLEVQAKRVESQTIERAMLAAANGLRIIDKESKT